MTIWIILFIFLIILIITVIALWAFWPKMVNPDPVPLPLKSTAGFLDPCNSIFVCGSGLQCQSGQCKRDIGQSCRSLSDCVNAANVCQDGTCQNVSVGELNDPSPCNNGLTANSLNRCKGDPGFACRTGDDCLSGTCESGTNVCAPLRTAGLSCNTNDNCADDLTCSKGFCQTGNTTGTEGAACYANPTNQQAKCNTGLTCDTTGSSAGQPGVCREACETLGQVCGSDNLFCSNPYDCINNVCLYPIDNTCNTNNACPTNFTCKNNKCIGQQLQPCTANNNCVSNNCNLNNKIAIRWNDSTSTWVANNTISLPNFDYVDILYTSPSNSQLEKQYVLTAYDDQTNTQEIYIYDTSSKSYIVVFSENYNLIKLMALNDQLYAVTNTNKILNFTANMDETLQVQEITLVGVSTIHDAVVTPIYFYTITDSNKYISFFDLNGNLIDSTTLAASQLYLLNSDLYYRLNTTFYKFSPFALIYGEINNLATNPFNFNFYLLNNNASEAVQIPLDASGNTTTKIDIPGYFSDVQGLVQNGNLYLLANVCN